MSSSSDDMSFDELYDKLYIPYDEIESATNNYADENLVAQGSLCKLYKGQLLQCGHLISIVVCKYPSSLVQRDMPTHLQREMIYSHYYKHVSIVSIFKFSCTLDLEEIVVYKHEANGSLDKHLSSRALTWLQRLNICVGVAHALKYLHYDAQRNNCYVIHGNIKSSKILLDHNWEPKLHGVGHAVIAKKNQVYLISEYKGSLQYLDPTYENTGGLTHKSDVFSFGVVLFEVLFGREAEASIQNNDNWYFARLARSHYEEGKLDDLIDPDLRKQMNMQSFNIFAETAYYCLKELRSQRPNMNQVVSKLEKALELQHKHEQAKTAAVKGASPSNYLKEKSLDRLRFRLSDIELATNKFSDTCCIGSGGYGKVYEAELNHRTVAVKRIFSRDDKQGEQGFITEIEMLSKCKHQNIVSLLGFCDEGAELILVYEYVSNGSLADYLGNIDNMVNLTWAQRIQICLDIAHGLNYLHIGTNEKESIIHRDIKSDNILLNDEWVAKIADFGFSKLHHAYQQGSTINTNNIAGTKLYLDPEYMSTGKLKTKSDVYSFGVVLFEIMCGKLAYDETYNEKGLPAIARQCFVEETIKNLVDPKLMEADENISMLVGGVNQDSLYTFTKVAYQCLAETQSSRPTMDEVVKELIKALDFQKNSKDNLFISLKDINLGTHKFSDCKCVGKGTLWKLYKGKFGHANGFAKRWDSMSHQGYCQFLRELEVLVKLNHNNIIGLLGYCNEENENIIIYEYACNGRLNEHLCDHRLTWMIRLKICIGIAEGLEFLHAGGVEHEYFYKHGDIKSGSIFLDGDWNAKISNFEMSRSIHVYDRAEHADDNAGDSLGYIDPSYQTRGFLTSDSDTYSLGVILIEMLCGRLAWEARCKDHSQSLGPLSVRHYNKNGNLDGMIFKGIKEQIVPQSLTVFQSIAIRCLEDVRIGRPKVSDVVIQLKKALKFQEGYEIWERKLPVDYKEIIKASKTPKTYYSIEMKQDLYDMFCNGILLQGGKVLFSLGSNGERNEMVSARKFSYKNHTSHKWRYVPNSRFTKVSKMFDISNLKIHIKIRTQFLSPGVDYKVYLIFRFCGSIKSKAQRMYVNLKYKMKNENLHAYFATWREDGWMMIELFRFLNHRKDTDFKVLLESFSRCYCGSHSVYVEGVQFQEIHNVKHEDTAKLKQDEEQAFKSKSLTDKLWWSMLQSSNGQKLLFPAKKVVNNSSNVAITSRFHSAIEFQRHQVFRIKCRVKSQMLCASKENVCYLVFKLSDKCRGLHGPVIVRDLFHSRSRQTRVLYFRSPDPWNWHDTDWVPRQRKDGWMEVILWKFKANDELINDLFVHLKLVTYEGTMAGLIARNIEFR